MRNDLTGKRFLTALLLPLFPIGLAAQTVVQSSTDGALIPAIEGGTPASSYALSGLDRVNNYNGNLNVTIPLLKIGGRGTAGYTMVLPINRRWGVRSYNGSQYAFDWQGSPDINPPAYSPGYLHLRRDSGQPGACWDTTRGQYYDLGPYVSRIVWTAPDGSETTLLDTADGGQPLKPPAGNGSDCSTFYSAQLTNRRRGFRSSDGSGLSFISDADISDENVSGSYSASGVLSFRDGTKYFIGTWGEVDTIEDRNGNLVQLVYGYDGSGNETLTVTDPLNRTIQVVEGSTQDTITYPGANGSHVITVNRTTLQNAVGSGSSIETYQCLFPELGGSSQTTYNPTLVQSIVLADGSSYVFQYNSYGELTRLQLPTLGVYQYSYPMAQSCQANSGSGVIPSGAYASYSIYRRISERDDVSDGANISARQIFQTPSYGNADGNHPGRKTTAAEVDFEDPAGNILRKETHYFYGNPSAPDSIPAVPTDYANWTDGIEFKTNIGSSVSTQQILQRGYGQRPCGSLDANCWFDPQADTAPSHDPQNCQINTTLDSSTSGLAFLYDQYNNPTDKYEYGYGAAPAVGASCPASAAGFLRHTQTSYNNYVPQNILGLPAEAKIFDGSGNLYAGTTYSYDEYGNPNSPLFGYSSIIGHDNVTFAGGGVRGNPTTIARWLNVNNSWLNNYLAYDIAGNIRMVTDAKGNQSSFSYNDSYSDGQNRNSYAFATSMTNAKGYVTSSQYNYGAGKPVLATDPNGIVTAYAYNDSLDRVTQIRHAAGLGNTVESQTNYYYQSPAWIVACQDQNITTDCGIQTQSVFDGLGRPVETRQIEYGANDFIAVDTSYDALGRVYQSFNPSRINISTGVGDGLDYPTTYSYDALGRVTQVKTDDGSVTATSYLGDQTTVTDPAQRVRQSWTDALGRLVKVVEDPSGLNYQTIYTFAADDTLQSVTQGSQTRTFAYDSLARLTRATNPESGAASYTYDANGNVLTRTDGRSVVTSYTYDALNRLTGKSYSDTTPAMGFSWDAYRIGSLAQASDGYTSTLYPQYDALGRVTQSQVALNFQNYTFQYAYNLAGSLTRETYPSGRVIMTSYDTANRPYAVSGTQGLQTNYVTQTGYWPHGAPYWQWYGNGIFPVWVYNSRLQPNNIYSTINNQDNQWLFWEQLGWSAPNTTTNDNGILQTAVVSEGGPSIRSQMLVFSQLFGYDMANRLTAAIDTNWVRTFHYDAYGNMSVSANGGAPLNGLTPQWQNNVDPFDPATNRLLAGGYDAAGNQAVMGSLSMWRDAENRQYQTWDSLSNVLVNYLYDSEGRRVQKTVAGGTTTDYVYDALGQLAAEYTGAGAVSKEYIRLGGQLVAIENASGSPCTACYLSYDHLGSVRLVTDQNANVVARHEYLPFGEALDGWAGRTGSGWGTFDSVNQRFTGQERDSETNLDFFQARYFGAALGRFTTPDEPFAGQDPNDPQSWNLYSYGLNNPLRYTDPDGHDAQDPCGDNPNCVTATAPYPGLSPLDELLYRSFFNNLNTALQIGQQTQQTAQQTFDWLSAPRDPGCMTAHTMGGAGVGMAGGAVAGAVFGPADVLTVPMGAVTGYVGGAAFGRIGGLISCMSGSGGTGADSGGGRGSGSSARLTKPQQRQTAKYLGMKEVKGLTSQGQPVFEKGGRYFSFSNTRHTAGEVFKELDRNGNRIATTDLNLNRIGQ